MPRIYDLHMHSTASDGAFSPTDLVERCALAGITSLAVTDHDTTQGLAEARVAADAHHVELISAVEISTSWRDQSVHIVGLRIDEDCDVLQRGLLGLQTIRRERAAEIGARLARAGLAGALEAAQTLAGPGMITRMHFARHIVQCGRARNVKTVFERFLTPGKPGYVATQWAEPAEAIRWIRQAGGVAVLAHPQRYKISATARRCLVEEFKEAGGIALEVVAGTGHAPDIDSNAAVARRFGLAASVGSDFHSPEHFWLRLGNLPSLPAGLVPVWEVW